MRRREVVFLASAQSDLNEIFQYVLGRTSSRTAAERYVDRLIDTAERIGDAPEAGRSRDDLLPGLRIWSFERKVVLTYRLRDDVVEITNLFAKGHDLSIFYDRHRSRLHQVR